MAARVASLIRIRPARNEWRYYALEIHPDLFGGALLLRHWGRLGTAGRWRLDAYPDEAAAAAGLVRLATAKRRRFYRDRFPDP
jgi:predicted DNA-binding WGR domain protein